MAEYVDDVVDPPGDPEKAVLVAPRAVAGLIPPGVVNVVNGFGVEAGKPLASSSRVAKVAFQR